MTTGNRYAFRLRPGMRRGLRAETPLPTRLVSNEEFPPLPQTPAQRRVEDRILAEAARLAPRLGLSRRDLLRGSGGMATSLLAMNAVFGRFFDVQPIEAADPAAFKERSGDPYFIFDVQLHYVGAGYDPRDEETGRRGAVSKQALLRLRQGSKRLNPKLAADRGTMADLAWANMVKEIFLDSETAVAMMSGIPAPNASLQLISNASMAATRDLGNQLGASQRMMTQGMLTPNFPDDADTGTRIADMEHLVKDIGIRALKTYTGAGYGVFGEDIAPWWMDDEQVAYPMLEEATRLGIDIVNVHKGLRLGVFDPEHIKPRDIPKAARDWPNIHFGIYHSGFEYLDELRLPEARGDAGPDQRLPRARARSSRAACCPTTASTRSVTCSASWSPTSAPITSSGAPTRSGTARRSGRSTRSRPSACRST